MADLDAELLALAGGDSSDEETPVKDAAKDDMDSDVEDDREKDDGDRKPRPARRSRKRADDDLSSAMSESSSSPPPDDNAGPIFPHEKLFYSAKDKAEIMALPEIQREELLSERAQQVDRHNQDIALRRLLASRERDEARAAKKRRLSADDDTQRKSARRKGGESGAIEAYKRQREQKGKRDEMRRRDAEKKAASPARAREEDASGESEVEWDEPSSRDNRRRSVSAPRYDPPAELADLQRARVGRSNFAQVCFYPGFADAIRDCYARISLGPNPSTGKPEYRIGLIKGFTEGRPYAIEGPNGRNFITTQYCRLAHGKAEKEFPFIACSDSPFTEAEFNRYRQTMIVEDCKMPPKSHVASKVADINRLLNHEFTKEELEEKLRKQGTNDTKKLIFSRIQLERRRAEAVALKDEAAIAECDAELARLTGPKLAFGTTLVKPRSTTKSQQERLAEINLRNQKLNTENVRRAQLAERKAAKIAAAAVARGEAVADRFARVKTRARTYYESTDGHLVPVKPAAATGAARSVTPVDGVKGTSATAKSASPAKVKPVEYKGVPVIRHRPTDEDNIAALDLDIDIDI